MEFFIGYAAGAGSAFAVMAFVVLTSPRVIKIIQAWKNRPRYRRAATRQPSYPDLDEAPRNESADWDRQFEEATHPSTSTRAGRAEARRLEQAQRRAGMF